MSKEKITCDISVALTRSEINALEELADKLELSVNEIASEAIEEYLENGELVSIPIPHEEKDALKEMADKRGVSMNKIINEVIKEYLEEVWEE